MVEIRPHLAKGGREPVEVLLEMPKDLSVVYVVAIVMGEHVPEAGRVLHLFAGLLR